MFCGLTNMRTEQSVALPWQLSTAVYCLRRHMCVCVCVCVYIYIYTYTYRHTHTHTHTHAVHKYRGNSLSPFDDNYGYANAPKCYVICTLPCLFKLHTDIWPLAQDGFDTRRTNWRSRHTFTLTSSKIHWHDWDTHTHTYTHTHTDLYTGLYRHTGNVMGMDPRNKSFIKTSTLRKERKNIC